MTQSYCAFDSEFAITFPSYVDTRSVVIKSVKPDMGSNEIKPHCVSYCFCLGVRHPVTYFASAWGVVTIVFRPISATEVGLLFG